MAATHSALDTFRSDGLEHSKAKDLAQSGKRLLVVVDVPWLRPLETGADYVHLAVDHLKELIEGMRADMRCQSP